jgi:Lecithin retinol acyltransferase
VEDLPIGAHLASPRRIYVHHGIYVGGGRVVHYAGFNRALRCGPVEEVSVEEFSRGRPVTIHGLDTAKFDGPTIASRARSRIGEDRYGLWTNNCEHFVAWCVSGTSRSAQIEALKARLRRLVSVFAAPLAASRMRSAASA